MRCLRPRRAKEGLGLYGALGYVFLCKGDNCSGTEPMAQLMRNEQGYADHCMPMAQLSLRWRAGWPEHNDYADGRSADWAPQPRVSPRRRLATCGCGQHSGGPVTAKQTFVETHLRGTTYLQRCTHELRSDKLIHFHAEQDGTERGGMKDSTKDQCGRGQSSTNSFEFWISRQSHLDYTSSFQISGQRDSD